MLGKINGRSDPVIGKARSDTDTERIRWFWHFEILSVLSHLQNSSAEQYYFCCGGKNQVSDTPEVLEDQVSNQDLDARL